MGSVEALSHEISQLKKEIEELRQHVISRTFVDPFFKKMICAIAAISLASLVLLSALTSLILRKEHEIYSLLETYANLQK